MNVRVVVQSEFGGQWTYEGEDFNVVVTEANGDLLVFAGDGSPRARFRSSYWNMFELIKGETDE